MVVAEFAGEALKQILGLDPAGRKITNINKNECQRQNFQSRIQTRQE
jgi:hypothetical protein